MRAHNLKGRVLLGVAALVFIPVFWAAPAAADACVSSYQSQTIAANLAASSDVRVTSLTTCAGDDVSYQVPLSASVTFDGHSYSSVYATTNSVITFGAPDGTFWDYPQTPSISLYSMDWLSIPALHSDEHLVIAASDGGFQVDLAARPYGSYWATADATNIVITAVINSDGSVAISFATSGPTYADARTGVRLTDGSVVSLADYGVVQVAVAPTLAPTPEPVVTPTPVVTAAAATPASTSTPTATPEPVVTPEPVSTPSIQTTDTRPVEASATPEPTIAPSPVVMPSIAPTAAPEPVSVDVRPAPEPIPAPVPEPLPAIIPEPVIVPEPTPEPTPDTPQPVEPQQTAETPTLQPTPPPTETPTPTVSQPQPIMPATQTTSQPQPVSQPTVSNEPPTLSEAHAAELAQLMREAEADDPQMPEAVAAMPVIGPAAVAVLKAFNALGNIGADLTPAVRARSKKVVTAAVILTNIAAAASSFTGRRRK